MINIGFIGVGGMGMYQVRTFQKVRGARIVAAADPSPVARQGFAQHMPGVTVYDDHRAMLKDGRVEAVVVAVPTYYHAPMAIDAMKAGRPVMVEKPMARTVSAARRMTEVSARTKQLLMVAHCRRYDADWGTFAKVVTGGRIGRPVLWRHVMCGGGPGGWFMDEKLGGGPIMDGAVHDQDFANYLFGDPQSVSASAIKLACHSAVDTVTTVIQYAKGDQLMLSWSWGTAHSGGGVQDALGTRGSVLFGAGSIDGQKLDHKKFGYYRVTDAKSQKPKLVRFARKDMYVTQGRHFLDCIQGKAKCRTPGKEAIKAVAVAEAILKCCAKGGSRKVRW